MTQSQLESKKLEELARWLKGEAATLLTQVASRRSSAEGSRSATVKELKAAKKMAEMVSGRKLDLAKTTLESAADDARMQESIAGKLEKKAQQFTEWAALLAQQPEWVRVEDGVPEHCGHYLFLSKDGVVVAVDWTKYKNFNVDEAARHLHYHFSHWCEISLPAKEESSKGGIK
jgi:hypothetical protein